AALFVGALGLWTGLQLVIDRRVGRSTASLTGLAMIMAATALAMVLAFQDPRMFRFGSQVAALAGLLLLGSAARIGERLLPRFEKPGRALVVASVAAAALAAGASALFFPGLAGAVLEDVL